MRLLAFDTETGGLDPKATSLLTAYFVILDKDLKPQDSLYLKVKPNDGNFQVTPGAMNVNKINLEEHTQVAVTYETAKKELADFLRKHSSKYDKLIPVAHNIEFDLGYINEHLLDKKSWENFVSYRKLDTAQIANFFKLAGIIPDGQSAALGALAKSQNIEFDGEAHSADADTKVMVELLKSFVNTVRK